MKESTYIKYSTVVNKHIMPKLGECCPLGFTTELMDDFIKELQFEDELAPKTVHDILVVLHGILKFASSKFAGSFPAVEINYPKIGKKEMRVLSREEQARLVAYLNEDLDSCRFGILLALCTGIRIGELCALQWESVSTNDKAIRIAKTLQRLHDTSVSQGARTRIVIGPPKSDTSVRTIPMTEYATGLCRRINLNNKASHNTLIQVVYQFGLIGMPLLISWVVISLRNLFTQLNAGHVKWKHALLMCVGVVLPWMGIDILQFDEFFLLPVYAVIGIAYSTRSTENKKLESSKGEI